MMSGMKKMLLPFVLFMMVFTTLVSTTAWSQTATPKQSRISTRATQTATNGILSIQVDDATGQFSVRTGAQHPVPNESVLFSVGTSYITLRDATAQIMFCNDPPFSAGLPNYTVASLVNATTTTIALGTTGFRTTYTVNNWKVEQDVVITGTGLNNTSVRQTVKVTNTSAASRQYGLRYMWDWEIAGNDDSLFRTRLPDGNFTSTFTTFDSPQFKLFEEVDDQVNPTFSIFGSVRDLPLTPMPTLPDQVRYCSWGRAVGSAWDFTNDGGNTDSAVTYFWGFNTPLTLAAGASSSFTQYITTQLDAIAPGLTVTKTAPATVNSGANLVYSFLVRNDGTGAARSVVLSDRIPAGTTFVSASGGTNPQVNGGVFTMTLPDIAPQSQKAASLTVRVNAPTGTVVNSEYKVTTTGGTDAVGPSVTTNIIARPTPTPVPTATPTPMPTATPTPMPTLPAPGPQTGVVAFNSDRTGNQEIYSMNADGSAQTRLTSNSAIDDQPSLSRDGRQIVFSSTRNGNRELYAMNVDGSNLRRLTSNFGSDSEPQFSADGSKIVFVSTRDGNAEIYSMNSDGSGLRRLTNNTVLDGHPSFSPNGSEIVFYSFRNNNYDIYRMGSYGGNVVRLTDSAGIDTNPAYSPRGNFIAFQSNRFGGQYEIFLMNRDGSGVRRVTYKSTQDILPSFSPDGTRLAYTTTRGGGDNEIYTVALAGDSVGPVTILTANVYDDIWPSWSIKATGTGPTPTPRPTATPRPTPTPTGGTGKIAFHSNRDGNNEIYVMNADGSSQTRLTNNTASDIRPSFNLSGTRIVFLSTRDGNEEIYVMNADGTGQTRLTNNTLEDREPAFSADGSKIVWRSGGTNAGDIWVMNADGTNQTRLTTDGLDEFQPRNTQHRGLPAPQ